MGVTSYRARARRALLHKQNSTYWVAIGRTTPWPNEDSPPLPSPGTNDIEEAIVFVRPQLVSLAKAVLADGDVEIDGQQFAFVADEDAVAEAGRFLYIKAVFNPADGIPTANFRQRAVFTELAPAAGHELDQWLAPANVSARGVMEYLAHTTMRSLGPGEQRVIELVIEFR